MRYLTVLSNILCAAAAYAVLYLYKVVLAPEGKRWEDFYGFNKGGRWRLSAVLMLSGTFMISLILWLF